MSRSHGPPIGLAIVVRRFSSLFASSADLRLARRNRLDRLRLRCRRRRRLSQ